jgi:hypothetical protein
MNKIGDFQGDQIVSGEHPGLPNQQIPLWEIGSNVLFEDRGVKPAPGQSNLFVQASSDRVTGMRALYLVIAGVTTPGLIWGTGTKLYRGIAPPNSVDVTRIGGAYTGGPDDQWHIVQFGQTVLATNGKDEVQYLSPAATAVRFQNLSAVSDLPMTFRCKVLWSKGSYVMAFNTDTDPTEVRWCDEDDPTTWTPTATNSARDLFLRDLLSPIIAATDLAGGIIVLGNTQAHFVQFTGAPFFFSEQHLLVGASAVSKNAVVTFDRDAYGFAPDGLWQSDGASLTQISTPSVHKYIYQDLLDAARQDQVVCWADANNVQIYWSFPTKDGIGKTVSYDRKQQLFAFHDYWRTAATQGGPWLFPITGSSSGGVFGQGGGQGAVTGEAKPVTLTLTQRLGLGYGRGSYGGLGYGGSLVVS